MIEEGCQEAGNFEKEGIINLSKKAFITGITGQDGSYLVESLLAKEYEVRGIYDSKGYSQENH